MIYLGNWNAWCWNFNSSNSNLNQNNLDNTSQLLPLLQHFNYIDLFHAYCTCRKHKRWTKSAIKFELDLEKNLLQLYEDISNGEYKISPSIVFVVKDPKYREVFAANFRDRILHHLLINRTLDLFEEYFDDAAYNCRKERGGLRAILKLLEYMNLNPDYYILGLDIKSFFPSIPKELTLHDLLQFFLDREDLKCLITLIMKNDPTLNCVIYPKDFDKIPKEKSLFGRSSGIPIGDLTSLFIANFTLTRLDLYIKHKGYNHIRYVDDFRIILPKKDINLFKKGIFEYIKDLKLEFNQDKVYILPVIKGCPFIGYFVTKNYILPGKRLKRKIKLLIEDINSKKFDCFKLRNKVNSYLGFLKHCRSYKIKQLIFNAISLNYPEFLIQENKIIL